MTNSDKEVLEQLGDPIETLSKLICLLKKAKQNPGFEKALRNLILDYYAIYRILGYKILLDERRIKNIIEPILIVYPSNCKLMILHRDNRIQVYCNEKLLYSC